MDHVDEYAKLSHAITALEHQASVLRKDFLRPGARLRNGQFEVVVRKATERVFKVDLLPPEIRNDPRFWEVASRQEVNVRPLEDTLAFCRGGDAPAPVDPLRYRC